MRGRRNRSRHARLLHSDESNMSYAPITFRTHPSLSERTFAAHGGDDTAPRRTSVQSFRVSLSRPPELCNLFFSLSEPPSVIFNLNKARSSAMPEKERACIMFSSGIWRAWGPSSFDRIISSIFTSIYSKSGSNVIRFSSDCRLSGVSTSFVAETVFSSNLRLMNDW